MRIKTSLALFLLISVFGIGHFLDRGKMMIPEFTVPYFSGASLLGQGKGWEFNLNEVDNVHAIVSLENKEESKDKINAYRFSSKGLNARPYSINQEGYLYVIWIAKNIFFWTGDISAVKHFQLFVHALISFLLIILLKKKRDRILFILFYAINPFIINFAIYPFYYFWEVVPSAILAYFYLSKKKIPFFGLLLLALLLASLFQIRSSVLMICGLVLLLSSMHLPVLKKTILFGFFAACIWFMQPQTMHKHPGHVLYTSLGAYPNSYVESFNDTISWNAYRKASGIQYSYSSIPGMYDAEVFFGESKWCLTEYKKIAGEEPIMIIRNAILNYFQTFSFGYFRSSLLLSYFSAFLGLCFFSLLLFKKKHFHILGITAASFTYFFYLAPLPIYLYGSYLLIVLSIIELSGANPDIKKNKTNS